MTEVMNERMPQIIKECTPDTEEESNEEDCDVAMETTVATTTNDEVPVNPKRTGGGHSVPQNFHLGLILLAAVYSDGNRTIFSRALLDADFGPVGRNQHPARLREHILN